MEPVGKGKTEESERRRDRRDRGGRKDERRRGEEIKLKREASNVSETVLK